MIYGPNVIGATSESMVAGFLASKGYEVFLPVHPHSRADLIYVSSTATVKVQVKTSSIHVANGHRYEQCRLVRNDNCTMYAANEVDEVWVVGTHLWCIPLDIVARLKSISLLSSNAKPRKTVREYDPNDFIVVAGSLERPYRDRLFSSDPEPFYPVTNNEYNPETLRTRRYK